MRQTYRSCELSNITAEYNVIILLYIIYIYSRLVALPFFLFIGLEFSCNYSTWSVMSLVV